MKIASDLRMAYDEARERFTRLSSDVVDSFQALVEKENWFFVGRIKELQSFALKVETGRVSHPYAMDDFYACTIVVPTISKISDAETKVLEIYDKHLRKPDDDQATHKSSSDFVFDDLRLYLKKRPSISGRNTDLEGLVFELQIKTVLQYAWSIASHDLIYKTDAVSWPKERIAFQVKAMLEHAEIAIAEAEKLAKSPSISKLNKETEEIVKIIECVREIWPDDLLPTDVKRLAHNFRNVIRLCEVNVIDLRKVLNAEINRLGVLPKNLSPYSFLVQAFANSNEIRLQEKVKKAKLKAPGIFVHKDMELPDWMNTKNDKIIRVTDK